jgi:hypothetical protein
MLMPRMKIGYQEGETYPFVVIDNGTGEVLYRHDDLDELESVCRKLRWRIMSNSARWVFQPDRAATA